MVNESRGSMTKIARWFQGDKAKVHLALITVQLGYGGYYVLTKAAMSDGVNRFVFAVYREIIGIALLTPVAYFTEKSSRTEYTWPVCSLIVGLGFTGIYLQQTLFLSGLAYTNAAFAAAVQNAIPVFTFFIAVVCRVEVIRIRKLDGIAKLAGIIACVAGAVTMSLYKGNALFGEEPGSNGPSPATLSHDQAVQLSPLRLLRSTELSFVIDEWKMGSLFLVGNCFCMGVYTNLQIPALRRYPAPASLTAWSLLVGTVALIITGMLTVSDASDWILRRSGNIASVAYAGAVASGLNFSLQTWANHRGGPALVAAYIPLQTLFSAVLGLIVLNEPIYLGTVIGGILILSGLYLVVWAQQSHRCSQELQGALPFSAVLGDQKEPLLPHSIEEQ